MPEAAAVELTKFTPPQPTSFEFRHQPFDLLAASPPSNANLSDFRHANNASRGSVESVQHGQSTTISFAGVVTSLRFRFETEGEALPMNLEKLTKAGIRLMEDIYMDEIVGKKVYEFCLFAAPLKIKDGIASPIRLLAIT